MSEPNCMGRLVVVFLEVSEFSHALDNWPQIIDIPSGSYQNCRQALQPLDVVFFSPLCQSLIQNLRQEKGLRYWLGVDGSEESTEGNIHTYVCGICMWCIYIYLSGWFIPRHDGSCVHVTNCYIICDLNRNLGGQAVGRSRRVRR